ncbi:hypothetical protein [Mucilaginibacter ginsenosidivorans]|uniref:hypothetical protein n=1 Tax=Mucilaginibacter ginsenosidivorans TaxID=398053 RepID=UPI0016526D31|nr:hypothetical protein [Mucilaginibacter ginsenosidivorans]
MPTTKQSGTNNRENENDRKMATSPSRTGNDRNKENRNLGNNNNQQSGNTSKSHR